MKRIFILIMLLFALSMVFSFALECWAMVDDSIILYFRFDEGKGDKVMDTSNYRNDGVINGAKWADGKYGSALVFDGINNYVEVKSSDSIQLSNKGLTLAAWFRTTETARADLMIIEKGAWDAGEYALSYPGYANKKVRFQLFQIPGQKTAQIDSTSGVPELSDDKWHYAAGIYDADNHVFKVYVDGKLEEEQGANAHIFTPDDQSLFVGTRNNQGLYFFGYIDELLVANVPFTSDQLKKHQEGNLMAVAPAGKLAIEWGKIRKMD